MKSQPNNNIIDGLSDIFIFILGGAHGIEEAED
jgi:hypothetical protein